MSKGTISVHTENIFPIIKKFLYSDHEIFLRELVSNAVDATQKLKAISSLGEFTGETGELNITVEFDKEAKTITIRDKGVGMTDEEVKKYINQIAFSGAEEFVNKYKDKGEGKGIIGKFGLGFYSSFMVASHVEIITKSWKEGESAVKWDCDGSPEYTIVENERTERGTDIILHVAEDSLEFLDSDRLNGILSKYCRFLPVEVKFEDKVINDTQPAWTKKPADLKEEDYEKFYNDLYPFAQKSLFHIHLNVDYPFNLTGILYFPKLSSQLEVQKNKIQLYCNQVFVTDSVEGIVPEFLTLMHGVIDSPDIPLNVSRSYLQSDSNVKKISSHISKKVTDKLDEIFHENRSDFEAKWDDLKVFIQYGMLSDEKFYDRAKKFTLLKSVDNTYFTFEEYLEKVRPMQNNKDEKTVFLYANDAVAQHSFIETAKSRGYDVLLMDGQLDSHFVNQLEQKLENVTLTRVDADTIDKLIAKDEEAPSKLDDDQKNLLKPIFEGQLKKENFTVVFENLSETDAPAIITQPEFMRRMKDMSKMGGSMYGMGNLPDHFNLVVNANHALVSKVLNETDNSKQEKLVRQVTDLALLAQNMLKGEELTRFVKRSVELIE